MKKLTLLALLIAPLALSACMATTGEAKKDCCGKCGTSECSMKHDKTAGYNS